MISVVSEDDNMIIACEWTSKMKRKKSSRGLFTRALLTVYFSIYVIRHIYSGRLLNLRLCV